MIIIINYQGLCKKRPMLHHFINLSRDPVQQLLIFKIRNDLVYEFDDARHVRCGCRR